MGSTGMESLTDLSDINPAILAELLDSDPEARQIASVLHGNSYHAFRPRPDREADYDEQTAFIEDESSHFRILLGGTGSGKTHCAAWVTAKLVRETVPRKPRIKFWIIGETYEQTCEVCWQEKLSWMIPPSMIFSVDWYREKRKWPFSVMLKHPTIPGEVGWIIEFKSYAQGRERLQGQEIDGYWFNEEVPLSIVEEVQGRCRKTGGRGWADFTPIEIRSPEWPDRYEDPPEGWAFYHLNTLCNPHIDQEFMRKYLASVPEDMRPTRTIGCFASFEGQVYKEFRKNIHVIEPYSDEAAEIGLSTDRDAADYGIPATWFRWRGIDFGYNNPFCCLWLARDPDGRYIVYDEHFQSEWTLKRHAEEINRREWRLCDRNIYRGTWSDHDAQARAELASLGIGTSPANKELMRGIECVRKFLQSSGDGKPRLYVMSHCVNLIREFRSYHWAPTTGTDNRERNAQDAPQPFDDHALDALRYVIYSNESGMNSVGNVIRRKKKDWQNSRFVGDGSWK